MLDGMAGKASGRTACVGGVSGRFTVSFAGQAAARVWRDGQCVDPLERAEWWLIVRGGWLWALAPADAQRAAHDPAWTPPGPDLSQLPVAEKERLGIPVPPLPVKIGRG